MRTFRLKKKSHGGGGVGICSARNLSLLSLLTFVAIVVCLSYESSVLRQSFSSLATPKDDERPNWNEMHKKRKASQPAHGDSSTATVMGLATGYPLGVYKRFVGSLRKSGFRGHIILGVAPEFPQAIADYFAHRNVTAKRMKWVDCTYVDTTGENKHDIFKKTQCAHPYPDIKIRWSRFPLARDWLTECETCTGPVLLMDVRDSFFQQDPFGPGSPPIEGLQVFEEHPNMTTSHWLVEWPVRECKGIQFEKPVSCSGTTIGTREAMLQYLERMYQEMREWIADPKCRFDVNGDDQSIHNYLYYTDELPYAKAIPNREGIVHTVGYEGGEYRNWHEAEQLRLHPDWTKPQTMEVPFPGATETNWIGPEYGLTDDEGFLTNFDGSRSRVVHQFDRMGPPFIQRWLDKQEWATDEWPLKKTE